MQTQKEKERDTSPISRSAAFGIILPLCLVAALLACLFISVANDMYAFVKPDREISVRLSSPHTDKQLARLLRESGVIDNELSFLLYLRSKGRSEDVPLLLGEWVLNSNMSYREIVAELL